MDYHLNDNSSWAWPGCDLFLQTDANIEDISYMFEETTPIKSCGDFDYHLDGCEILSKRSQEGKEYSSNQNKRRRVLDFNNGGKQISSSFLKSKERINSHDVSLPELDAFLQDDFFPPVCEDFGHSEAWLTECLNDTDMNVSSDDGNASITSDVHNGAKEQCVTTPDSASSTVEPRTQAENLTCGHHQKAENVVFKGRKSYMRTPSKGSSTVVYPFDFIKPSVVQGDVTLKDINQLIHAPPPKPKEEIIYPTSAFSGKPVVGKTKIPTRGNGSITIMRTKG